MHFVDAVEHLFKNKNIIISIKHSVLFFLGDFNRLLVFWLRCFFFGALLMQNSGGRLDKDYVMIFIYLSLLSTPIRIINDVLRENKSWWFKICDSCVVLSRLMWKHQSISVILFVLLKSWDKRRFSIIHET